MINDQIKLFKIRHINARKTLQVNCNNSIKLFANKLGKKEQQCSNFLRENKPVNIGPMIARQIESTFNYPTGWLDKPDRVIELDDSKEDTQILSAFWRTKEALNELTTHVINGLDPHVALRALSEMNKLSKQVSRLRNSINQTSIDDLRGDLLYLLDSLDMQFYYNEDIRFCVHDDTYIRLTHYFQPVRLSRHLVNLPNDVADTAKLIEAKPFLLNGEIAFAFCQYRTHDRTSYTRSERKLMRFLDDSLVIDKDQVPEELLPYINSHPILMENV